MIIRNLTLAAVAALALAACGNDATPTSSGVSAPTSAAPAEAPKVETQAAAQPAADTASTQQAAPAADSTVKTEDKPAVEAKAEPAKEDGEKKSN